MLCTKTAIRESAIVLKLKTTEKEKNYEDLSDMFETVPPFSGLLLPARPG